MCLRTENLSRTCSQNAGACHGHHSGAATPSEAEVVPVSTPDGTTPLTAEDLDWFGRRFFNVVPAGANRFLTCAYDRPEDMDLAAVLACGPEGGWNVTSQERDMIAAGGTDSVVRIPLEQAQELMLRYTGLALSDTQGVGLDSLRYLSEYNAYYRVGGEAEAATAASSPDGTGGRADGIAV